MSVALGPMGALLPRTSSMPVKGQLSHVLLLGQGAIVVGQRTAHQAAVHAGEHFQWSDTVKGQVSSSFFLGYTVTNFVGAYCWRLRGADITPCMPALAAH